MLSLQTLRRVIGPAPERVALEGSVVERVDRGEFEQLKVEYTVEAGERISAYVLLPKDCCASCPAVFCHHQHAGNFELGKSEAVGLAGDPDLAIGPELARLGFVVLAPDAIGFEDRNWSFPTGRAQYVELTNRLVKGQTLTSKVLHDVTVGVDYLCALPNVDSGRIGFIGHSYGGRMAIWTAAFDDRIKASVSNCGCVSYRDSVNRDVGIQAEFCVPGIMSAGDIEDIVCLAAPRVLYLSATNGDKYSRGAEHIYRHARETFPDGKLKCRVWAGGHVFTREMRQAAYEFLSENL